MKVTLVGYVRRQGHSQRTGRDYDFYELSMVYPRQGYAGLYAEHRVCNPDVIVGGTLLENSEYEVLTDFDGNITSVKMI